MTVDSRPLASPPTETHRRDLWLQHAAGMILFKNVREYALGEIKKTTSRAEREAAEQAIDDALYGLMMTIDGVSGGLRNSEYEVDVSAIVRLTRRSPDGDIVVRELDLRNGDGFCMGFHGWKEGDFGEDPIVVPPR